MASLTPELLGALFPTSVPLANNVHNSIVYCSEVASYTDNGLHTAEVAASGILLSHQPFARA